MGILRNLKIGEFSIVRGADRQPANPEAIALFYKATSKEAATNVEKSNQAPAERKKSLAGQIADAVKGALSKAQTRSVQSEYNSQSRSTEAWTETITNDDPAAAAQGDAQPATTIVITDAVDKATPAQAADPDTEPIVKAVAAGIEPLVKTITSLDSRLAKLEAQPVGSQRLKTVQPRTDVFDTSGSKFPEFTKFLGQISQLSPGQKLRKDTISSGGWSYGLSYVEAGNFIDYVFDQSTLLKLCRSVKMPDKKYAIDKIGLGGNVLVKGTSGTDPGDTVSLSGPTQVLLDASEVIAIVSIGDDTLEDNIEGEAFVQHLLGMISRSAANELEQAAIHGDTAVADTGILDRWDGWYKLAKAGGAHVHDAMDDTDRYWPGTNGAKATTVLKSVPSKYRQDTRNLAWLLNNDVYLDYNEELASKGYSEAWQAITGVADVPLRGIKNVRVPMLKTDIAFTHETVPHTDGTFVMVTDLRNLIFGIHREIGIEPFRQPRKRCTDYILTMRAAVQVENGDAVGIYDHAAVKA